MTYKNLRKSFGICAGLAGLLFVLPSLKLDPSNPPVGQTGAPSETTCSTASGCHYGGAYSGNVQFSGVPDLIEPNKDYSITLSLTSVCKRTGFELTVLDKNSIKCGSLTAGTNNNLKTSNGRQYVRQSNASTLSGGKSTFAFNWKSPSSVAGDSVIFYYVMLQANGDGGRSGDNAVQGRKAVLMQKASDTKDIGIKEDFKLSPNPAKDYVKIQLPADIKSNVTILKEDGKEMLTFYMDGTKVLDLKELPGGVYFVRASINGIVSTKKLVIVNE